MPIHPRFSSTSIAACPGGKTRTASVPSIKRHRGQSCTHTQTHTLSLSPLSSTPRINSIALVIPGMPRFVRPAKTIIEEVLLAPPTGFLDPRFKRTLPPFSNYCRHWAGASKHETPRRGRKRGARFVWRTTVSVSFRPRNRSPPRLWNRKPFTESTSLRANFPSPT